MDEVANDIFEVRGLCAAAPDSLFNEELAERGGLVGQLTDRNRSYGRLGEDFSLFAQGRVSI
jgi:hypothetical protein